MNFEK
jgi:hypothetical protein